MTDNKKQPLSEWDIYKNEVSTEYLEEKYSKMLVEPFTWINNNEKEEYYLDRLQDGVHRIRRICENNKIRYAFYNEKFNTLEQAKKFVENMVINSLLILVNKKTCMPDFFADEKDGTIKRCAAEIIDGYENKSVIKLQVAKYYSELFIYKDKDGTNHFFLNEEDAIKASEK